jgi:hypothetical protein
MQPLQFHCSPEDSANFQPRPPPGFAMSAAGTTVYMRGGVYCQQMKISSSGNTREGFITFRSQPGEQAVFDGGCLKLAEGDTSMIELANVNAARRGRAEAVEHRQFAMIQIWKPKHSATVIRLDSVFAHGDGFPCRRIGTTANRLGDANIRRARIGRVLSAIAC